MSQLNSKATTLISTALYDATEVYTKLLDNPGLPERLRSQFAAQCHMAKVLAELFESSSNVEVPDDDVEEEYKSLICW